MTVPTQSQMHRPLLEIAAETGATWSRTEFFNSLIKRLVLTEEDLSERTSSGANRARVNSDFALSKLAKARLLHQPSRARYEITSEGRNFLGSHYGIITLGILSSLAREYQPDNKTSKATITDIVPVIEDVSPQDKIDVGYRELNEQLADDLLDSISRISPEAFEHLVVDLLEKMGYGKGETVGRSGDGGIDGIINQDALGLEKVYIQAKRWQNQVGEPEIRNFSGSLDARGARKGVFVTTSRFSETAKQTAQTISAGNKFIRLIDGPELAKLMMAYDIGVVTQYAYKIQKLDENYFFDADPNFLYKDSYFLDKYNDSL